MGNVNGLMINFFKKTKEKALSVKDNIIDQIAGTSGFKMLFGRTGSLQGAKDVLSNSTFTRNYRISQEICENVFMDSWIGKRIVQLPVYMAIKNGLTLEMESEEDEKKVWELYEKLKIKNLIIKAQISADVYGSSILLLKDRTQDPLGKAREYKDLEIISAEYPFYSISPLPGNTYKPGTISFTTLGVVADESFCATFVGAPILERLAPNYKYYGMSIYQSIWSAIVNDQVIMTSVANITYRSSIRHYRLKDLNQLMLAGKSEVVLERMALLDSSVGVFGSAVMDSEDEMQVISQSLTGLPEIDKRSAERLSAATGIPATILLGKSPDGQNSTGKSDENNMGIYVEQYQEKMLLPIERLFKAMAASVGVNSEKLKVSFKSPTIIHASERPEYDEKILNNASSMLNGLGLPEDVVRRYLYENSILTQKEHDKIILETTEFDAIDEPANTAKDNKNSAN